MFKFIFKDGATTKILDEDITISILDADHSKILYTQEDGITIYPVSSNKEQINVITRLDDQA